MLYTTFRLAKEAKACRESYLKFARFKGGIKKWGKDNPFPLTEVIDVCGIEDAVWCLRCTTTSSEKIARLFACDYVEHVLAIYEKQYPNDNRPRQAIETARAFANGKVSQEELDAASSAAKDAASAAAWDAAWATRDAASAAAWAATWATSAATWATSAAAWAATWDNNKQKQKEHFLKLLEDE